MRIALLSPLTLLLLAAPAPPRHQPLISYEIRVDSTDLRRIGVTLRILNPPDTVRLAMAAHPEYDDRYWRHVSDLTATRGTETRPVTREDSAVWRIAGGR